MSDDLPFLIDERFGQQNLEQKAHEFSVAEPFQHIVIDNFLRPNHAAFLARHFPTPDHPIWLDWRKRAPNQYGKQGAGDSRKFSALPGVLRLALQEFNASPFLSYLERLTGTKRLLPDPHFTGGGMHQILNGGILDVHTDFNYYERLKLYRRINVLIYLNPEWTEDYGGALELWDGAVRDGGKCVKSIAPLYNRVVIFNTNKKSFHGHPKEWNGPPGSTRRSIALYYYTAEQCQGEVYNRITDFQGVAAKETIEAA